MDKEILGQLQIIVQGMASMEERLRSEIKESEKRLTQRIDSKIEESEKRMQIYIENEVGKRIDALFDGYKLTHEKQWELERQMEKLAARVEALENKIA